ncbi:ATP-binding protein [Haloimpatiens sp. FM7315]|uniref:sensor histidine kinase n=1 Tax=Haloimpatiens sp. FM7315 TaxID=3298609 RepID=UPI00370AE576
MKNKITKKLIKYFIYTMCIVISLCFIMVSTSLSKLYTKQQFNKLKVNAEQIKDNLQNNLPLEGIQTGAILVKDNEITPLVKFKMGKIQVMKERILNSKDKEGKVEFPNGESFLYFKYETTLGTIVTFENAASYSQFINIIYIVLIFVFILAVFISIPIFYFLGKIFTKPILELSKISDSIAKGNLEITSTIKTGDEIEELYKSIKNMSSKLKEKNSFQKKFIANISHDFKTPLSIIRNYSEAINDGILDEENIKLYSRDVIKEVDKLNNMVLDLLEITKLQEGYLKLNKTPVNLKDFLFECANNFKNIADTKNVSIEVTALDEEVLIDKALMFRVMYNFINNSIKFSKENSTIKIISKKDISGIKISIEDSGIGVSKDNLKDIWNRYYKTNKSGGIGLGLPICKEILELHDFPYGVNSIENKGSSFYFKILTNSKK